MIIRGEFMNVSLFTFNSSLSEMLVAELLRFGVTVVVTKEFKEVVEKAIEHKVNCIFLDIDSQSLDWVKVVESFKTSEKTSNVFILILTGSSVQDYVNDLILAGANGIFDTKQPLSSYINRIQSILKLLEQESNNKRRYVRVQPEEKKEITANLDISGHTGKTIKGKVRDISVVAAAIELFNENEAKLFNEAIHVNNLQLKLGKKVFFCEGKFLRKGGNIVVLQFEKTNKMFEQAIANYIYNKINFDKI